MRYSGLKRFPLSLVLSCFSSRTLARRVAGKVPPPPAAFPILLRLRRVWTPPHPSSSLSVATLNPRRAHPSAPLLERSPSRTEERTTSSVPPSVRCRSAAVGRPAPLPSLPNRPALPSPLYCWHIWRRLIFPGAARSTIPHILSSGLIDAACCAGRLYAACVLVCW